jgi:ABC-type nitrate/sulfonate/bicarbonate transport system substrate-binding protein
MERGVELSMLMSAAVFTERSHASGVVVRADRDYGRASDLKGMQIGVPSIQSQFYVEQILAQDGLRGTDVTFTMLTPPDMIPAMKNGAIDAAWEVEPLVTVLEEQRLGRLIASGFDAMPGGIPWLVVSGSTTVGKDQSVREGVARAVLHGMRDFYHAFNARDADPAPIFDALAAHTSITDRAVLEKVGMHTVDPNGLLETTRLDAYQDYYLARGVQTRRMDLNQFIDRRPLDAALRKLGRA